MALSTNAPFRRVADPVTLTKALVSSQPRFGRGFLIAIGQRDGRVVVMSWRESAGCPCVGVASLARWAQSTIPR
jgi:hypothetical protein